jgi:hypothetical protein
VARRGRWSGRGDEPAEDPDLPEARDLVHHHLLLVSSTVHVSELDVLLQARLGHGGLAADGEALLGRHSRLRGPYELSMEAAVDAGVPMPWTVVYALDAPAEREDPPLPGTDDRDGFAFAFPAGLPWREEGRGLHLLVSMARRLAGAVRIADTLELIVPDPERAVDHTVHAPYWLDPEVLRGVVARELPTARLAVEGQQWTGPPDAAYSGAAYSDVLGADPLPPGELDRLHHAADQVDMEVLSSQDVLDAYAVVAEIGPGGVDGAVEVFAHVAEGEEPAVAGQEWAALPFVSFEVRWHCPDPLERERRTPSAHYVASRSRVAPTVAAVTRAVVESTSGVVVDEDGFWVDRYRL